ncbi:MAG TPA: hypothetical protein VHC69_20825 [Polyangiaceae bacterium]|nr:hypothetical protein [Polyangiaceae bacterium]
MKATIFPRQAAVSLVVLGSCLCAAGCGGSDEPSSSASAGGASGSAGIASSASGAGGVVGTSGSSSTGGAVGAGGTVGTGGTVGAGGAVGTGGTVGTSGTVGAGGAIGTGGTVGAGGTPSSNGGSAGATGTGGSASGLAKFSFFVTSFAALQRLSNSQDGFGGDLRFGETGAGAGLRGADKICATIAETSMPGAGAKGWHAFLSASDDGTGKQVNAIERIGSGPWYDRLGRLFGNSVADINAARPTMADTAIRNDFPNEDGVPNHAPDPTMGAVDNHDMLTGSDTTGKLYGSTATCLDWTSAVGDTAKEGKPRVGHSWPRGGGGGLGGPGGSNMDSWMSALTESGCKAGASLIEMGPPQQNAVTVGSGGGYGGFYCFAMTP